MYATGGDGQSVLNDLAAVEVAVIADRPGQELRNELRDLLTPRGRPATPHYELVINLTERIDKFAIRRTGVPTRANLTITADYVLTDLRSGASVLRRDVQVVGSYNLIDNDYSTLAAENFTRSQNIERIAQDIRTRLAAYFAGHRPEDPRRTAAAPGGTR